MVGLAERLEASEKSYEHQKIESGIALKIQYAPECNALYLPLCLLGGICEREGGGASKSERKRERSGIFWWKLSYVW